MATPFVFKRKVPDPDPKYVEFRVETRGRIESGNRSILHLEIKSPGFKNRFAFVPVTGGFATLLEVHLAPLPENSDE